MGWNHRVHLSVSIFCSDDIFWRTHPFVTEHDIVMHHYQPECRVKRTDSVFNVKVTVRAVSAISSELSVLLILLQPKLVRWYTIINHVFWKIKLLRTSRSQCRFEISINICPDDVFWTAEPFVTKFGTVINISSWAGVSCKKDWFASFSVKGSQ